LNRIETGKWNIETCHRASPLVISKVGAGLRAGRLNKLHCAPAACRRSIESEISVQCMATFCAAGSHRNAELPAHVCRRTGNSGCSLRTQRRYGTLGRGQRRRLVLRGRSVLCRRGGRGCGSAPPVAGTALRRSPTCSNLPRRRQVLVDVDQLLQAVHLHSWLMYSLGSVSAVGSWFCISVTSRVRKSLDEMVDELLLLVEVSELPDPVAALARGVALAPVSACPAAM